jgi:hypothetical protein
MFLETPVNISTFTSANLELCVGFGALLATFLASVMADDQEQRLKNGTFGAIAGSAIGGIAAMLNNQPALLVTGFLGSSVGGFLGWIAFLVLSRSVGKPGGRNWLEYYVGGFQGLRDKLNLDDQQVLLSALDAWILDFSRMLSKQKHCLLSFGKTHATDEYARMTVETWLILTVDIFALILKTLADKPEYRSRVTIIVFGKDGDEIIGKHWISYTGSLPAHKPKNFDGTSIGYDVLTGAKQSPYFFSGKSAKDEGQDRGEQSYRPFFTYRLNNSAVLSLDWPEDLKENDEFVKRAKDLFQTDITPSIAAVLDHWSKPLQEEVELKPL